MDRRNFIKSAAAALAFQVVPSRLLGAGGVSPSGRVNVGMIGVGGISSGHWKFFAGSPLTQIMAICDVNETALAKVKNSIDDIAKTRPDKAYRPVDTYIDYMELLSRDDIDAVCICTPDHWHVAIALAAVQRGKAVYLEKPMSLTIEEGRILADAVKLRRGVLQVGSQQRSEWAFRRAAELVRNGYIGNVRNIYTKIGEFPPVPDNLEEQPVPAGFHYDKWLGQAAWAPYNAERVKGDYGGGWRRFYDYGARKDGDWGAHHFDVIQWALGRDDTGPTDFFAEDIDNSPYRHYRYADGITVHVNAPVKNGFMIHFEGDEGEVFVSRGGKIMATPSRLVEVALKSSDVRLHVSDDHRKDFLNAVINGADNACTAEIGHRTATVCHLSAIAKRLGAHIKWDPAAEKILNNAQAERMVSRPRRSPYFLGV